MKKITMLWSIIGLLVSSPAYAENCTAENAAIRQVSAEIDMREKVLATFSSADTTRTHAEVTAFLKARQDLLALRPKLDRARLAYTICMTGK